MELSMTKSAIKKRKYVATHTEAVKAYNSEYYQSVKDKESYRQTVRKACNSYYARHREELLQKAKARREAKLLQL